MMPMLRPKHQEKTENVSVASQLYELLAIVHSFSRNTGNRLSDGHCSAKCGHCLQDAPAYDYGQVHRLPHFLVPLSCTWLLIACTFSNK